MPHRAALLFFLLASCVESVLDESPAALPIVVTGQVPTPTPAPGHEATWAVPPGELDVIEVVVEPTAALTKWTCWVWTGATLGPRSKGLVTVQKSDDAIGGTETVLVELGPAVAKRRDRMLTCKASKPSVFHGLRVWPRVLTIGLTNPYDMVSHATHSERIWSRPGTPGPGQS